MKYKKISILVIIFLICCLPYLFTRSSWWFGFDESCGVIGDTIGGTTAPFIGLISIYLLYKTLTEQIKFNREQKEIEYDEQFKSTFFNLLNVQRDLVSKLSGTFPSFNKYGMKNKNHIVNGLDFFKHSIIQLNYIYGVLDRNVYRKYLNEEMAETIINQYEQEIQVTPTIFITDLYNKYKTNFEDFKLDYITEYYGISEPSHKKYHKNELDPVNIALGYILFYRKYEQIGFYYRHLYRILKFIRDSEDERIKICGNDITEAEIKEIRNKYQEFAQFIQAQMSIDELTMLYYDSLVFTKTLELTTYYHLLENLRIKRLVKKEHAIVSGIKFKHGQDIMKEMINWYRKKEENNNVK